MTDSTRPAPTFDDIDQAILDRRIEAWNKRTGPRVGDFVIMPDGEEVRLAIGRAVSFQLASPCGGRFYFGENGMQYSGGCVPSVRAADLVDTGEIRDGDAWFFHHERPRVRGVDFKVPCRVFRYSPKGPEADRPTFPAGRVTLISAQRGSRREE